MCSVLFLHMHACILFSRSLNKCANLEPHHINMVYVGGKGDWKWKREWLQQQRHYGKASRTEEWSDMPNVLCRLRSKALLHPVQDRRRSWSDMPKVLCRVCRKALARSCERALQQCRGSRSCRRNQLLGRCTFSINRFQCACVCVCNFEKIQMTASDHVQAAAPLRFADFGDGTRPWSIQTFSTLCGLGQCGTVLAPCCWTWRSTVPSVLIPIFPPGTSAFRPGSLNACMHMCICKYVFWHAQGLGAGCARLVPSAWLVAILG